MTINQWQNLKFLLLIAIWKMCGRKTFRSSTEAKEKNCNFQDFPQYEMYQKHHLVFIVLKFSCTAASVGYVLTFLYLWLCLTKWFLCVDHIFWNLLLILCTEEKVKIKWVLTLKFWNWWACAWAMDRANRLRDLIWYAYSPLLIIIEIITNKRPAKGKCYVSCKG